MNLIIKSEEVIMNLLRDKYGGIVFMKKTVAALLALFVCVVLSACSKENENHDGLAV